MTTTTSRDRFRAQAAWAFPDETNRILTNRPVMRAMSRHVPQNVVMYTRNGCHLCDDAAQLLRAHGLAPRLIDIDADPALRAAHHPWVPVVEIDGVVRFRGRIEPVLLRRLLADAN